ncbi:hypothetical protein TNCV_3250231 [Trichonephila clavipes]|nr:hypothetical protein TNCV_3250231 [Trichonephila clavipes]
MYASSSSVYPTPLAHAGTQRDVHPRGGGRYHKLEDKGISFKKDQGERHTGTTDKRGALIRSTPSSWKHQLTELKEGEMRRLRIRDN